ncbi:helix-turn-helix domain-containing protein [Dyella telluris]|uniref:Helix-turn-helix transcriptional regulator n=1 Tax=Dyella telluris TaxID=2763498 RepID=A0A7G8Q3K0_9GAMM|nr:AraC family transcriptional regulator [Dyella telluris]QNK01358.1 helix-turn-helix transcriptional regulator [Dyella telluris]
MQSAYYTKQIAKRFHLPDATTLVSGVAGVSPILASRLCCGSIDHGTVESPPCIDAYTIQVAMKPVASLELRLQGRKVSMDGLPEGGIVLLSLECSPVKTFYSAFDLVRFEMSKSAIDSLSLASGEKVIEGLRRPPPGHKDLILFRLARMLLPSFCRTDEVDSLFMDQVSLALHSHVVRTYAGPRDDPRPLKSGLTSLQIRRASEFIEAHMASRLFITDLARECCVSTKYFARAFRRTFGMPPYQWLQERRVDRAQHFLRVRTMDLQQIAVACGFTSQSHFTRVFASITGSSPGAWRRYMHHHSPLPLRWQ